MELLKPDISIVKEPTPYEALSILQPWQQQFLLSRVQHRVLLNGRQSGKSTAITALIYNYFFSAEHANMSILYCCRTEGQAKKTMLRKLWDHHDPVFNGGDTWVEYRKGDLTFISKFNGCRLTLAGTQNVAALVGQTIDVLILDEWQDHERQSEVWTKLQPVVSGTGGSTIFAGTANGYDDHYDKWLAGSIENQARIPNWRSWKIVTPGCGTLAGSEQAIRNARNSLSPEQFNQEYLCQPMMRSGLVYPNFSLVKNISSKYTWQDAKVLHIGMDFNKNNMNATVCLYEDGTNDLYVVDEIHLTMNANTPTMIAEIKKRYPNKMIKVYPDATAKDVRNTVSWDTDHLLLEEAGFPLIFTPGNPRIKDRVNLLNGLIRTASGNVGLYVAPHCTQLIRTFTKRLYDTNSKPIKDNITDHMADAIEYVTWHIYSGTGLGGLFDMDP